eukprot:15461189-Heterocapsa_arctica.AAC.1
MPSRPTPPPARLHPGPGRWTPPQPRKDHGGRQRMGDVSRNAHCPGLGRKHAHAQRRVEVGRWQGPANQRPHHMRGRWTNRLLGGCSSGSGTQHPDSAP